MLVCRNFGRCCVNGNHLAQREENPWAVLFECSFRLGPYTIYARLILTFVGFRRTPQNLL
jgi:hypothetical protein